MSPTPIRQKFKFLIEKGVLGIKVMKTDNDWAPILGPILYREWKSNPNKQKIRPSQTPCYRSQRRIR